jgi:hypothetical protein
MNMALKIRAPEVDVSVQPNVPVGEQVTARALPNPAEVGGQANAGLLAQVPGNEYNLQDDPGVTPGATRNGNTTPIPDDFNPNTDNEIRNPKPAGINGTFSPKPVKEGNIELFGQQVPGQNPRGANLPFTPEAVATANRLSGGSTMSVASANDELNKLYAWMNISNPTGLGSVTEQQQAAIRNVVDSLASENANRALAIQRTELMYRKGIISEEAFRNRLARITLDVQDQRFLMDAASNQYSIKNLGFQDRQLTADLKRLDESLKILDIKLQNSIEVTKLQVQTARINADTLVLRTNTAILSNKFSLNDLVRGQAEALEGATAPRTGTKPRAVVGDDNWSLLPGLIGDVPYTPEQATALRKALAPLTNNPRDVVSRGLPTDVTPGVGLTPGQAREATADSQARLNNSLINLNKLSEQDLKQFGVTREQLAREVAMLEKPAGTPIERGSYSQLLSNLNIPTKVEYDAAWAKSKAEVERDVSIPAEVRAFVKGLDIEIYAAWVTSMSIYGAEKASQATAAGLGAFGGIPGVIAGYGLAKGGAATFREISQFTEQNPNGWANVIGGIIRNANLMNAFRGLEQSKTGVMVRAESLDLTRQAYELSIERTGLDRLRLNQNIDSLQKRQEALDIQYKTLGITSQRTYVAERVTDVLEQSRKTDQEIAKAQQANATVNRDAARGNYRFAQTAEQQLIFEKNLAITVNAMIKFNGKQIGLIVANGTGDIVIKTDTGLIVSRENLDLARRFLQSQIYGRTDSAGALASPRPSVELAYDDPRILKAAAVLTQQQFNKQYPDAAAILQSGGGMNVVGQVAVSLVRDGKLDAARDYSPFNNRPVPTSLPQLEKYEAGYKKVWPVGNSSPGTEAPSDVPLVPRYVPQRS